MSSDQVSHLINKDSRLVALPVALVFKLVGLCYHNWAQADTMEFIMEFFTAQHQQNSTSSVITTQSVLYYMQCIHHTLKCY